MKWHKFPEEEPPRPGMYLVASTMLENSHEMVVGWVDWRDHNWYFKTVKMGRIQSGETRKIVKDRILYWCEPEWPKFYERNDVY